MEAVAVIDCQEIEAVEKDRVGRPCKYETHIAPRMDEILEWLRQGATDYSIADSLGIHQSTWIRYKDNYSNLASLYTRARTERNRLVMNAQYEKAKGIKETIKKGFKVKEVIYEAGKKVTEREKIEYADEMVYVPPDTNAADLYLRNNDPEYKSAKSESVTLIQNNFQLPQLQAEIQKLEQELKSLETIEAVGTRVIEE
jgi:uncharacterized protein (DUF433 family)